MLLNLKEKHNFVITIEEGTVKGGFGTSVLSFYNNNNSKIKIHNLGISDNFVEHGTRQELLDIVNLNENKIIDVIENYTKYEKNR